MTQLDNELTELKSSILEMWNLVISQMIKGDEALRTFDRDIAMEVMETEKRVNMYELKIDKDCENIFALFQPVATDLRLILASLKINNNLERIGDIAASIAEFTLRADKDFDKNILELTKIFEMYAIAREMLADTLEAFDKEDTRLARTMFKRDNHLDELDRLALDVLSQRIILMPEQAHNNLLVMSMVNKLERVGDQTKNIAEEIIFYFEAKVLKHKKRKDKLK
ncbi:MAG: phosphate signaling complex protein PhoU [Saprospiraceae bacterium]|nr:phosphate signaling complex protein PhoU [Saprospiraceae bacterium]